jgi:hypothetical protein
MTTEMLSIDFLPSQTYTCQKYAVPEGPKELSCWKPEFACEGHNSSKILSLYHEFSIQWLPWNLCVSNTTFPVKSTIWMDSHSMEVAVEV